MTRASSTCCWPRLASWPCAGELPVNVRFACDGEEETGGHSILEFLAQDERGADAAVIFDSGMIARGAPGVQRRHARLVYFHVTLRTGERDLHSGVYGGAALNAAHALSETLTAVVRPRRAPRRAAARRDSWRRPPRSCRAGAALPAGAARARRARARARWTPTAAEEFYLRTFAEPALDVNGIGERLPAAAEDRPAGARRAPTSRSAWRPARTPRRSRAASSGCCATPPRPRADARDRAAVLARPPASSPPDSPAVQLGLDAFERALGVRPALIRSGGTLPIVPALSDRGIPTIITGFSLPDANIHSPNERMLVDYIPLGIAAARGLLQEFSALRQ